MVTRVEDSSVLTSICGDGGPLHHILLPLAPAGRPRPGTRNGFRFLRRYGQHGGCKWRSTVPSIPAHEAVTGSLLTELLVAVLQVDEVGGLSGREIVGFRGASRAEMQGWPAVEGLLSASVGTAEVVGTLGLRLACRSGGGRWLSGRKPRLTVGEWRPAGARAVRGC